MAEIIQQIPLSNLNFKGKQPFSFDLGKSSTLHYVSSIDNVPDLASYKDAYIRKQRPSNLDIGSGKKLRYSDLPHH